MITRRDLLAVSALPFLASRGGLVAAETDPSPVIPMIAFLPPIDVIPGEKPTQLMDYTDIRAVLNSVGLDEFPMDLADADAFIAAAMTVPLDSPIHRGAALDWHSLTGFGPSEIDQVLVGYQPPDQIRVYSGSFTPNRIVRALVAKDYVESISDDFVILASPSGDDLDLTSELDAIAPGAFNYVAVSPSVIVTTRTSATMDLVVQTVASGESLADQFADGPLLPLLEPMTGFYVFDGATISAGQLGLTPVDGIPELPEAGLFSAGVTRAESGNLVQFLIDFEDAKLDKLVSIISDRIATVSSLVAKTPYSELLGPVDVKAIPNTGVISITGSDERFVNHWQQLILNRDLIFIATE